MREQAKNKYRELPNKEKSKTTGYGRNIYQNMSEEDKQRLKENQKSYCKAKKSTEKFFFVKYKNEKKVLIFDEQCINKNPFS